MRKILKPSLSVEQVLEDCLENMTSEVLKTELIKSKLKFNTAEQEFDSKKKSNKLHEIVQLQVISSEIHVDQLKSLYSDRMVNKANKARLHYDYIFSLAPNGKCPYCSQRVVRTLDHYLPKSKYPLLSITPLNLVPSCSDCNKDKLVDVPSKSEEESLHPYYDDVEGENWLKMRIIKYNPFDVEFYTSPPQNWNDVLKERIKFHFNTYKINELYCIHAQEEFENIKLTITELFQTNGSVDLKKHLADGFRSREVVNKNSWQSAFYRAVSEDISFINGGFI